MTRIELLQAQLELAIAHQYDEKLSKTDYPGYWLLIIEEQLEAAAKHEILSHLKLKPLKATMYKLKYCQSVAHSLLLQE